MGRTGERMGFERENIELNWGMRFWVRLGFFFFGEVVVMLGCAFSLLVFCLSEL